MNIIFDLGNVLFDLDLDQTRQQLQSLLGTAFEPAYRRLSKEGIFHLYETGGISTTEFVDAIRFTVDPPLDEQAVVDAWNAILIGMPAERLHLIADLRQRHSVFLLSNINELHAEWIERYMLATHRVAAFPDTLFDGAYYSHLIRLRKPNVEVFEYVLADAELKPQDTMFIDDLPENVAAAERAGITGVHHPAGTDIIGRIAELTL